MVQVCKNNAVVVFDLDDTLYKEIEFVYSAYKHLAYLFSKEIGKDIFLEMVDILESGISVFDVIKEKYELSFSIKSMIEQYRYHKPDISLYEGVLPLLDELKNNKIPIFVITDGRSVSQRNKIEALLIGSYFTDIFVSEEVGISKPNEFSFRLIKDKFQNKYFYYIGDNTTKDFLAPNALDWTTICIVDDGSNIHKQSFDMKKEQMPDYCIKKFEEIIIKN